MSRVRPALVATLGGALLAAGVVVFADANRAAGPADSGWTAYAPLRPEDAHDSRLSVTFEDRWTVLWTGEHLLGAGLALLGLLVLVATGAWLLGRRTGRRADRPGR